MLDPDDRISGRGQRALRKAGIATGLFDHDLMTEIEELNRDFPYARKKPRSTAPVLLIIKGASAVQLLFSPETEAARRLSGASRDLEKSRLGIRRTATRGTESRRRLVMSFAEEKTILEEIETAGRNFRARL